MDYWDRKKLDEEKHKQSLQRDRERFGHQSAEAQRRADEAERKRQEDRDRKEEDKRQAEIDRRERVQEQRRYAEQRAKERREEQRAYAEQLSAQRAGEKVSERKGAELVKAEGAKSLEILRQHFSKQEVALMFKDYVERSKIDHRFFVDRVIAQTQATMAERLFVRMVELQAWKVEMVFSFILREREKDADMERAKDMKAFESTFGDAGVGLDPDDAAQIDGYVEKQVRRRFGSRDGDNIQDAEEM